MSQNQNSKMDQMHMLSGTILKRYISGQFKSVLIINLCNFEDVTKK